MHTDHEQPEGYILKNGKFLFINEDYIPGMSGEKIYTFVYTLSDTREDDGKQVSYDEIKDLLTPEDFEQHQEEIAETNINNLVSAKSFNI